MSSKIIKTPLIVVLFFCIVIILTGFSNCEPEKDPSLDPPAWPTWVHKHWVWENEGTQESTLNHIDGFLSHGIPVGATIIDRPWATDSNTFIPHPGLYPDLRDYVQLFHSMDIRVIMWATSIVNETASNFQEGKDNGYFLSGGKTVEWWGGKGALLDYTNPEAVQWWHSQMDNILNMGIDCWKVDGTDPYVMLLLPAIGFGGKHITWAEYRDQCYRDFFDYSRAKLGNDRVIMARPVDDLLLRIGLPIVYTSRDINFAGWVGDNDNDWGGIQHALNNMFSSAQFNFVSYGSDIGGFRSDGNKYKDVFIRWAQLGAFCPVMENGGDGEHRPWMYDDETLDVYRKFVFLHHELIPYIYSQAAYSYELVKPTMRPQASRYTYMLGDEILVAPFFEAGNDRTIVFPLGNWIYMFNESKQYTPGIRKLSFPLAEFPVFIRKGAIIPLNVINEATGFGTDLSKDYTTILVYPEKGEKKFGLYEEKEKGCLISYIKDNTSLKIKCTPTKRSLLFRVYGEPAPQIVQSGSGIEFAKASSMAQLVTIPCGYFIDGKITWIAVKDATPGTEIQVGY
jgi:alpha-glucosidase (family GH31 glycosyl hydrolase)